MATPTDVMASPSLDDDKATTADAAADATLTISLLFVSGARVALAIDARYMRTHALLPDSIPLEPEALSVHALRECIYADWVSAWGDRPAAPEYIRLIHFGRLLDDAATLGASQLSRDNPYNVLHLSVRPVSMDTCRVPRSQKHDHRHRSRASRPASSSTPDPAVITTTTTTTTTASTRRHTSRSGSGSAADSPPTAGHSSGCGCVIL
ncbi:uncharacterized protein V1518DRAFT_422764 [Limtongia smithiae]|uniref:uncharacterized protein n=1 Tax=Limtongia smithiae TaxID=1125753 RepID=UPI0034CEA78B